MPTHCMKLRPSWTSKRLITRWSWMTWPHACNAWRWCRRYRQPARIPPHLIPLVEVVPRELKKEILGFVVNRLQRAIMREACYLVQQGVCTVDELDDCVTNSVGMR